MKVPHTVPPRPAKGLAKQRQVPGTRAIVSRILPGFSRRLAAMLSAGMPIVSCLNSLSKHSKNENFKHMLIQVKRSIENGSSLSKALRQYPRVFDDLYVSMIESGEAGGQLAETIGRLASFLEARAKFRKKIKSAMTYPVIVLTIALGISTALIVFIVPIFQGMFASFKQALPAATQVLVDISEAVRSGGLYIVLAIGITVVILKKWKHTPGGEYFFDSLSLRIPVFGDLNRNVISARFATTFGQLMRSGVPILTALDISGAATGNKVADRVIQHSRSEIERGETLSSSLLDQAIFPGLIVEMLQAGESTGKIDEMMDCIADFLEDEVNTTLNALTSLLEPMLMVFLGVIIGGMVVCLFLPIFKLPGIL